MDGINYNEAYVTVTDKIYPRHRSKVILHENWQWYKGEFTAFEHFIKFCEYIGLGFEKVGEEDVQHEGAKVTYYKLNRKFREDKYFWHYEDLPDGVRPIVGHSNGSLVTCFFKDDGETITIFRPNPNAHEVYMPMTTENHIEYMREHGGI